MIDGEAEETDAESDDEDQVNHALEDEDESDDVAPHRRHRRKRCSGLAGCFRVGDMLHEIYGSKL